MKLLYFELEGKDYCVPCKAFLPEGIPELLVIGVHGFGGDKESSVLSRLGKALCDRMGALICFDLPAHGKSKADDSLLRVDNCKADLSLVIDYAKKEYPESTLGIFATSFGGYISLLCPEILARCKTVLRAPAVTMADTFINKISGLCKDELLKIGSTTCGFERKMAVCSDFYLDLLENSVFPPPSPFLVIHGTADDVVPFDDVKSFCSLSPLAKLISVEGADHRFKKSGEVSFIIETAIDFYFR